MTRTHHAVLAALLFAVSAAIGFTALKDFRAGGERPYFYQENFGPAVMVACGRGFGLAAEPPSSLTAFLHQHAESFSCDDLPRGVAVIPIEAAAHANWYYLYYATATVWRITGVSWPAVDYLGAVLCGAATLALYALFLIVSGWRIAAPLALLLTLSPANLVQLLSVRDYSKAPFVLGALVVLGVLIIKPMSRVATIAGAALYGVIVAIGYGFRGDLAVMVPLGAVVVLAFLPGSWRANAVRNVAAAAALVAAAAIVALPILRGLDRGGCQFHVALLGLTTPLTNDLALASPIYRFGDNLTDTFAILKTGDYATRVLGAPVPPYCQQIYDVASGQLYFKMGATFPADLLVRAYGSVLFIFRWALEVPDLRERVAPLSSLGMPAVYRALHAPTAALSQFGLLAVLAATIVVFSRSMRLGLAWSAVVLFICAYPAIQFEGRHWFHLRFVPWFAALIVAGELASRRNGSWWSAYRSGVIALIVGISALAVALAVVRQVQQRSASTLFDAYLATPSTTLPIASVGDAVQVDLETPFEGPEDDRRRSELLSIQLSSDGCAGSGPLLIGPRYEAQSADLDLSTDIEVKRPAPGEQPPKIFVPVFASKSRTQTFQAFSGLQVTGASSACIASVARVDRAAAPALWLQVALQPDWHTLALHQAIKLPRFMSPVLGDRW